VDLTLAPVPVNHLGIVGCGLMGCSIAALSAGKNISVTMVDVAQSAIAAARETFSSEQRVTVTDQYDKLASVDLIIEAVVETLPVKKTVHERIEAVVASNATIASNTSSIPLASMDKHFRSPERFCGIHFCHPEVMSLVEVIAGPSTSAQAIANAVGFVRQLGKMPVAIDDGAGFVVNRLLSAMLNQSLRLLSQGLAVADIDAAMRKFGFKAGPFEIIDIIGADTCMYAGRTMWEHKLECVSLSPILPRLVKHGRLGRKAGVGFYRYPEPRGQALADPELQPLLDPYQDTTRVDGTDQRQTDLARQILVPVVLEATRIIEQGIVSDFRDIDLAFTHGLSFPQQRGGLLYWADQVGVAELTAALEERSAVDPALEPTDLLRSMADSGQSFYSKP
jgi:3-hydroxyacyl-CoA dehydrogenase